MAMTSTDALSGKVALVTGGSKGIGLAIASALVARGAHVAISGRRAADLERASIALTGGSPASKPRVITVAGDVGDPAAARAMVDQTAQQLGALDVLVNNAGVGHFVKIADTSDRQWREIIDTNVSGIFYCSRAAIPHMRRRGGGWILNISSLASKNPFVDGGAYCASKAAVNAFSEVLMQEVRHDNIRVSYILPGSVRTAFGGHEDTSDADWKLTGDDVARVVVDLIAHEQRSLPSRVELRPSRPPRK
jgi:NAD(P)-dependent dehydrogenase (short-subunit alcohol dehydrogenase family)